MKKTDVGTITRTILIIVALINQGLVIAGKNPLPFEDDQIAQVISFGFTTVTAIIAWWKNNNFSQEAKEAQHYLDALKSVKKKPDGQVDVNYKPESEDDDLVMG